MKKTIVHICLRDAVEPQEPCIPLPGGVVMMIFDVVEPVARTDATESGAASLPPGRRWRWELPMPGLTFEAHSEAEVVAILRRELEGLVM